MGSKKKKAKKRRLRIYWSFVCVCLIGIMAMVYYLINNSRVFVKRSEQISLTNITWKAENENFLRIKEPFYVDYKYHLVYNSKDSIKLDSIFDYSFPKSEKHTESITHLKPPFQIWKFMRNDTLHVIKNNKHLIFVLDKN